MGRIVVIDGLDASGKATQVKAVSEYLEEICKMTKGKDFDTIDFPRYGKRSAKMVESYLAGDFGTDPMQVDPYIASTAYALDRAISYREEQWGRVYDNGGLILADRYISSNIPHQGCKVDINNPGFNDSEFKKFVGFLHRLEVQDYDIPQPSLVIFLESSHSQNESLLKIRQIENKDRIIDIHEGDISYLDKCRYTLEIFKITKFWQDPTMTGLWPTKFRFINISDDNGNIRSIESIRNEILHNMCFYGIISDTIELK